MIHDGCKTKVEVLKMTRRRRKKGKKRMRKRRMVKAKLYAYLATFCEMDIAPQRRRQAGRWYLLIYYMAKRLRRAL
jgi:hypothetical protein